MEKGILRKGTLLSVDAIQGEWVRLEKQQDGTVETGGSGSGAVAAGGVVGGTDPTPFGGGWMLTDGKALKLGILLQPQIIELPKGTKWQVTRAGGCTGYEQPGGSGAKSSDKGRRLAECSEGASVDVTAECGLWARVATAQGPTWVEMDCFFAG